MKKMYVFAALLLCVSLLVSCGSGCDTSEIENKLSDRLELKASVGELAFVMTLDGDNAAVKMTAPRTLSGLTIEKTENGLKASYKGMTVPLPEASAKKVFMLADIISAVKNSLADKTHTAVKEGDTCVITAAAGDTVCTLIFDSNGSIMSAEITANGKNTVFNVEEISQSAESSAAPVSSQPASSEINSN